MNNTKTNGLWAFLVGMTLFSASAHGSGTPVVDSVGNTLIATTNTTLGTIQATLTSFTQQYERIISAIDGSSAKVSKSIGEAQQDSTQRVIDVSKGNAIANIENNTKPPQDPCGNAGRALGNPDFDRIRPGLDAGGPLAPRGSSGGGAARTGSRKLDQAISISEGREKAPSPETQAMLAAAGSCEAYASGVRKQSCTDAGLGLTAPTPTLPNADVLATSLYTGAQTAASSGLVSHTFTGDQLSAAKAFARNLYNSNDLPALSAKQASTDAGKRYLGVRDNYLARVDMAQHATAEHQSSVKPNPLTIPMLKAIIQGGGAAAKFVEKDINRTFPNWRTQGISTLHYEYIEVARRYSNPDWIVETSKTTDPATLQREQIMLSAQTNYLLNKLLSEARHNNNIAGAAFMSLVNRDLQPELINLHKTATASR